eukprot:jgi/Picre1/29874/NNA_005256.t1
MGKNNLSVSGTVLLLTGLALVASPAASLDNVGGPAVLNFGVQNGTMGGIMLQSGFVTTELQGDGFVGTIGRYTNWSCAGATSYIATGFQRVIEYPSGKTKVERFCEIGTVSDNGTSLQREVTANADACTGDVPASSPKLEITKSGITDLKSGVAEDVCAAGEPVVGLDTSNGPGLNLTDVGRQAGETLPNLVIPNKDAVGTYGFKDDEVQNAFLGVFTVDNKREYGIKVQADGNQYSEVLVSREEDPMLKILFNNYLSAQCWGNGLYSADLLVRIFDQNLKPLSTQICSSGKITESGSLIISNDPAQCTLDLDLPSTAVLSKVSDEPLKNVTNCDKPTAGLTPVCLKNTEKVPVTNAMATMVAEAAALAWYDPEEHTTCGEAPASSFMNTLDIKTACVNSTTGDVLVYFQGTVPCTQEGRSELLQSNPNLPFTLDFAAYNGSMYPEFPDASIYGPEGAQVMTFQPGTSASTSDSSASSSSSMVFTKSIYGLIFLYYIALLR